MSEPTSDPLGVSVVVCCYNSARVLPPTLAHLSQQRVPPEVAWEVVVVDNASTDETAALAESQWAETGSQVPFRVVREPTPGLSHARQRGVAESRYAFLIYCDDDNWLSDDFVARSFQILRAHEQVGACGGCGTAVTEGDFPAWFPAFQRSFAAGPQGDPDGSINYLYGAGLGLRKRLLELVHQSGYESLLSDRKGKELSSGGDNEICQWIKLLGYELRYDPELRFQHYVDPSRLNRDYVRRLFKAFGEAQTILKAYRLALSEDPHPFLRSTWVQIARTMGLLASHLINPPRPNSRDLYWTRNLAQLRWFISNPGRLDQNVVRIREAFADMRAKLH